MQASDAQRFTNLIRGMGRTFGQDVDQLVLDVYWLALSDWTLCEFEAACGHLLKSARFMPRPAEFNDLRKAGRPTGGEAWQAVLQHIKGAYRNGSGLDAGGPIDQAVASLGGYKALAFHDTDYMHHMERRFGTHYEELLDVTATREAVPQIARPKTDGLTHVGRLPGLVQKTLAKVEAEPEPSDA